MAKFDGNYKKEMSYGKTAPVNRPSWEETGSPATPEFAILENATISHHFPVNDNIYKYIEW